jgi:hypothetical protein
MLAVAAILEQSPIKDFSCTFLSTVLPVPRILAETMARPEIIAEIYKPFLSKETVARSEEVERIETMFTVETKTLFIREGAESTRVFLFFQNF